MAINDAIAGTINCNRTRPQSTRSVLLDRIDLDLPDVPR
jgi:hypothetical protein